MEASQGFDAQKPDLLEALIYCFSFRNCHTVHITCHHDPHPVAN
jgi:hypothetical protein